MVALVAQKCVPRYFITNYGDRATKVISPGEYVVYEVMDTQKAIYSFGGWKRGTVVEYRYSHVTGDLAHTEHLESKIEPATWAAFERVRRRYLNCVKKLVKQIETPQ
jgi:hypothetical protein